MNLQTLLEMSDSEIEKLIEAGVVDDDLGAVNDFETPNLEGRTKKFDRVAFIQRLCVFLEKKFDYPFTKVQWEKDKAIFAGRLPVSSPTDKLIKEMTVRIQIQEGTEMSPEGREAQNQDNEDSAENIQRRIELEGTEGYWEKLAALRKERWTVARISVGIGIMLVSDVWMTKSDGLIEIYYDVVNRRAWLDSEDLYRNPKNYIKL